MQENLTQDRDTKLNQINDEASEILDVKKQLKLRKELSPQTQNDPGVCILQDK